MEFRHVESKTESGRSHHFGERTKGGGGGEGEGGCWLRSSSTCANTAGCEEAVEFLLVLGADSNCASEDGATPLMIAVRKDRSASPNLLFSKHMQMWIRKYKKKKLLWWNYACLQSSADENVTKTKAGQHSCMQQKVHGNSKRLLLNEGAAVNTRVAKEWLHWCVYASTARQLMYKSYFAMMLTRTLWIV